MLWPLTDLGIIIIISGFFLMLPLQFGRLALFEYRSETLTYWLTMLPIIAGSIGLVMLVTGLILNGSSVHHLTNWFGNAFYQYHISVTADWLAATYVMLTLLLLSLIAVFSRRYLHKDRGYHRFYCLLSLFGTGLILAAFAGTLELLIIGWELVGISSVLLISFFTYRPEPPKSALFTLVIYRCCDIGLIAAAFLLHFLGQHGEFQHLDKAHWFGIHAPEHTVLIGGLLLFAASGKAALFPFSSWLPRAMEGPTPSSAVFYGALSVHLGPLLLMRSADIFSSSPYLQAALIISGLLTTLFGSLVGRVQNDIKSELSYASITQLGIIVIEIGLGLYSLALIHVFAHASLRTLQILRAPSLLQDYQHISQMLGHSFSMTRSFDDAVTPFQAFIHRFSLERAWLDSFWRDYLLGTINRIIMRIDGLDQHIAYALARDKMKDEATL